MFIGINFKEIKKMKTFFFFKFKVISRKLGI